MLLTGLFSIGLRGLTLALRFVFVVLLVKVVPPEEYGLYTLLGSIATIFVFVTGLEFHTYATRRFAASEDIDTRRQIIQRHFRVDCLLVPVGLLLAVVGIWSIGRLSSYNLGIVCALLVAEFAATELGRYAIILRRNVAANAATLVRLSLWMPAAYVLVRSPSVPIPGRPVDIIASCWLAGDVVAVLICLTALGDFRRYLTSPEGFNWRFLFEGAAKARWYYGIAIFSLLRDQADRLIIQAKMGTADLAVYGVLQNFGGIIQSFVQAGFIAIYLPRLIEAFAKKDSLREKMLARRLYAQVIVLCAGISVAIWAAVPFILRYIARPEYAQVFPLLPMLLAIQTILAISCVSHIVLYARHDDRRLFWVDLLSGLCILGGDLALIPVYGLQGALVTQIAVVICVAAIKLYMAGPANSRGEIPA
ncbi:MAG: lipopolysaccharide biosynthesis protein [Nevskiaceae bacterium]|nr:MAG: lipopolysaccharide biosynthesis protein [Nevskiaceae bacterium]